jgi:hypothetical protein
VFDKKPDQINSWGNLIVNGQGCSLGITGESS